MNNDSLSRASQLLDVKQLLDPIKVLLEEHYNGPSSKKYLTKKEAEEYLSVCSSTLDNYARVGELPKYKLGRSTRYRIEDLDNLLTKR